MKVEQGFQQTPVTLPLPYTCDQALQSLLERTLPRPIHGKVDDELRQFETRIAGPIRELASVADTLPSSVEPSVTQFDQWGQRVDKLHTSTSWQRLKGIAAEEGLVGIAFERDEAEFSRTRVFAKSYLFAPDGLYVGCPLSMTDGCARVLELVGTEHQKREYIPLLCSRDPAKAWTAGQWMTERPGGSDVSLTETTARPLSSSNSSPKPGDKFVLDGFKWFSSATDGDVALALARTGGKGSRGLSLFLIQLRDKEGKTNGVYVHRLKKKFGTKALPTAELSIEGAVGELVGPLNAGVKTISSVLNITRLHSSISCLSSLTRALQLVKSFASVRHIAGDVSSLLRSNAMHTSAIAQSEIVHRAVLHLAFGTIGLLGRGEVGKASDGEKARLRLLTPVVKAFAAELTTSELPRLMEGLGGQGYMIENQFARLIADANVERIWEGTTSILALDVVRVAAQTKGDAIKEFVTWAHQVLSSASASLPSLSSCFATLRSRLDLLALSIPTLLTPNLDLRLPRPVLFLIGYLASSLHLIEQASWSASQKPEEAEMDNWVVKRWVEDGGAREVERRVKQVVGMKGEEREWEMRREREVVYGIKEGKSKL
ncbi:acyl-CoA dehydrogenase [Rhodotorula toruloides]|uniref:Acyl-CoA dehydrogenase n=1 Tax=Rhodotorula toruloides TaxID=5286 RepID=A0A511KE74_RHOTO|nr:acyl-CoA dehydrogenase [Rhodotorula toruloides]